METVSRGRAIEWILTVVCPTFCCIGIGLIAWGVEVLTPRSGLFQLGVNAAIVGVLVMLARRCSPGRYTAVGTLIAVAMSVATVRSGPRILIHTGILMAMWVGVVFLNVRVLGQRRWVQAVGTYVVWSVVFAAGLLGVGVVLIGLFHPSDAASSLLFYARLSALTGVGLGVGFKTGDWLRARLRCQCVGQASR
ncbi:MAG: hypothetical protein KBE65_02860 [Phycisphaerae bacterium]|nr:hypothetical protein [Phycisphaerae bacterium]